MKPYDLMTDEERVDFQRLAAHVLEHVHGSPTVPDDDRPALIMLWVTCGGRSVTNCWAQFDIDPAGFVDEAARQGQLFMENMVLFLVKHPPPPEMMRGATLQEFIDRAQRSATTMASPTYRAKAFQVVTEFFAGQRAQGYL